VLLDIGLPGMDGFEVALQFRRRADLREVIVVAMTGYGHKEMVQKPRAAGFNHYLVKPLDIDALLALLSAHPGKSLASKNLNKYHGA